jgi:hypothetical protein
LSVGGRESDLLHDRQARARLAIRIVVEIERVDRVRVLQTWYVFVLLGKVVAEPVACTISGVLIASREVVVVDVSVSTCLK